MAGGKDSEGGALASNPVFSMIDWRMSHILRNDGYKPKEDIVEELVGDDEPQMIQECRDNFLVLPVIAKTNSWGTMDWVMSRQS